jgi:hypothetical protein
MRRKTQPVKRLKAKIFTYYYIDNICQFKIVISYKKHTS